MRARTHPFATNTPGTVLGWRRDGRPIYPIAGGSDDGETPTDAPAPETPETPTEHPKPEAPKPSPPAKAADDSAATIARLEKQLADARKDAGAARINAKQQAADDAKAELAQQIGRALGLVKDDTPPDPAKLAEQISTQTTRIGDLESAIRAKDVELAVHGAAEKHGAKVHALLDSRTFLRAIGDLDPSAKSFTADLDAAIKQAVDQNPNLRAQPQAGRSGADLTGGPGETGKARPTSLGAAIKAAYQ
ncbi:hypothetical protein ACFC1T_16945 [Kitasatospora sp. NPDC056076]|uniref:hypothetical protein n=1 Tax=Streptomycetaceae TaxID=2062 RepID=UPI0035E2748E